MPFGKPPVSLEYRTTRPATVRAATTITPTVCVPQWSSDRGASGAVAVAVVLIARFDGDVDQLRRAYDRAHALIMSRGGATGVGELRHHCAIGEGALYIIGVWESEERVRTRWASEDFEDVLTSVGFPSPKTAETTILELHATEPPL
jgi:hypothetical protein